MINGMEFGGPSVSEADKGYDKGGEEDERHEGCRIEASFSVKKVPGDFHFSTHAYAKKYMMNTMVKNMFPFGVALGGNGQPQHDLDLASLDMRHTIHELSFGHDSFDMHSIETSGEAGAPSTFTPLTFFGFQQVDVGQLIEYYIQAVPTIRETKARVDDRRDPAAAGGADKNGLGVVADAFQYTAHHHTKPAIDTLPAVVFIYEFAPFAIRDKFRYKPMLEFVTSCCAIVGGVLTSLGLVNRVLSWMFTSLCCAGGGDQLSPKLNRAAVQ